jgi:hypothetical protein
MNQKICPKCRASNTPEMSFCSNCGQSLAASQPNFPSDLPPTIFAGSPAAPGFTPNAPNFSTPPPNLPPAAKKSRAGMWLAILGGLGLLLILGGGIALGALYYLMNSYKSETTYNSSSANTPTKIDVNSNSSAQTKKGVGTFTEIASKSVAASEYFPKATQAAQAVYQDGSKVVYVTTGTFPSGATAKQSLKTQLSGVKAGSGTVSFSNLDKLSFDSATYTYKGYVFYEECTDKGLCTRMHSKDGNVLAEFMELYDKAQKN